MITIGMVGWGLAAAMVTALVSKDEVAGLPNWLQWGGPSGNFMIVESPALVDGWGEEGPKVLWKREIGDGYSSIMVKDGELFTSFREGDEEIVVALEADTGEFLWEHAAPAGRYPDMERRFGEGPNSTPLILEDRLVSIDIAGYLRCLDLASGDLLWDLDLHAAFGRSKRLEEYGYSGIPLLYDGKILALVGGDKHGVVALDPEDGSLVWGSEPFPVSYAPPVILPIHGKDQIVLFAPKEILGLDPGNGVVLWRFPVVCGSQNNLTTAVLCEDEKLWVASQFEGATRLLELIEEEGVIRPEPVWFNLRVKQCHWNNILLGDYIYGSFGSVSGSLFGAVNWRTGEFAWRQRGFHAAQCLYADGKILFLEEYGQLVLARVSPEKLEVLARHQLGESVCWTIPTLVGTTLFVRDRHHMWSLDLGKDS